MAGKAQGAKPAKRSGIDSPSTRRHLAKVLRGELSSPPVRPWSDTMKWERGWTMDRPPAGVSLEEYRQRRPLPVQIEDAARALAGAAIVEGDAGPEFDHVLVASARVVAAVAMALTRRDLTELRQWEKLAFEYTEGLEAYGVGLLPVRKGVGLLEARRRFMRAAEEAALSTWAMADIAAQLIVDAVHCFPDLLLRSSVIGSSDQELAAQLATKLKPLWKRYTLIRPGEPSRIAPELPLRLARATLVVLGCSTAESRNWTDLRGE